MIKSIVFKLIRLIFLLCICFFVFNAVVGQLNLIDYNTLDINYYYLVFSFCIELFCRTLVGFLFFLIFNYGSRNNISFPSCLAVSWASLMGKYIPGKIAMIVGGVAMMKRYGFDPKFSTLAIIVANVLQLFVCLIVGSVAGLAFFEALVSRFKFTQFYTAFFFFCLTGILIYWVFKNIQFFSGFRVKLLLLSNRVNLFKIFLVLVVQVLLSGVSIWCVIRSISSIELVQIFNIISVGSFAFVFGFVALFAPAGIGTREVVYLFAFTPIIGVNASIAIVLIRLLQLTADLGTGIAGIIIHRIMLQNSRSA